MEFVRVCKASELVIGDVFTSGDMIGGYVVTSIGDVYVMSRSESTGLSYATRLGDDVVLRKNAGKEQEKQ